MVQVPWRLVRLALAVVVAAGLVLLVAAAGGQFVTTGDTQTTVASADNQSGQPVAVPDGGVGAGEQLAGLVAAESQTVRGSVDRGAFGAQLDAAGSPEDRAQLVDSRLSAIDGQLAGLETTVDELAADGPADGTTARAVSAGAEAGALARLLEDVEIAILDLPAAEQEQYNLSARFVDHQQRAERLRERTREPWELVDGVNTETRADPVTIADVTEAMDRAMASASGADRLFDSERIDLQVHRANGSTLRLAVDTGGGEVRGIEPGPHDNPSVNLYTDYGVIRRLQRTDDVGGTLETALDENRIVYDGAGLYNSLRYGTADILDWLT
jgi:hypothetical protein